jgi:hypothetical protein
MAPEGFQPSRRGNAPTAIRERSAPTATVDSTPKRKWIYNVTGIGGVILTIVGLAGVLPLEMAALSALCLGFGLMMGGISHARDVRILNAGASIHSGPWFALQTILGIGGGLLGLVGLFRPAAGGPGTFGVIALGVSLVAAGVGIRRMSNRLAAVQASESSDIREVFGRAALLEAVSGICASVLGVLALFNVFTTVFTLAAALAVGSTLVVAGGIISIRMAEALGRS